MPRPDLMRHRAEVLVELIERADALALAADGPVAPTWDHMTDAELARLFSQAYALAKEVLASTRVAAARARAGRKR